jgi:hypothetical protein
MDNLEKPDSTPEWFLRICVWATKSVARFVLVEAFLVSAIIFLVVLFMRLTKI